MQLERLRRGVGRWDNLPGEVILDGANQHRLATPRKLEHLREQECGRGLAVGAGDASNLEFARGMSKKVCTQSSKSSASMPDL